MTDWLWRTLVWLVFCATPAALWLTFQWRLPPERRSAAAVWGTFGFSFGLGVVATLLAHGVASFTGLLQDIAEFGSPSSLAFVLGFAAPLLEAAKVAGAWPAFRSRHFDEAFDGILYASASATGFAAGQGALLIMVSAFTLESVFRVLLLAMAHPLLSPLWGHPLGSVRLSRTPWARFTTMWLLAALVHGILLHLTLARSLLGLVAAVPVLLGLAFLTWWAARDLLAHFGRTSRISARTVLPSLPAPSLSAMRHALRRSQRPLLAHWIGLGALTTTGVMLALVAGAVWLGHRIGLDFSAIEREDSSAIAIVPLVLLTTAALAAFPVSGYLVARASGADGVLEPALSAALAIVALLVMLGMAAPVALVFALAFTPVAFALACTGAWFGVGK
ncbi:MAG: PrsW family intramembrane metalloprotease [Polyangiaceae bacterium]|jgi:hypothetical protein|nr:PrsW family intramembrane metalloprotease [Polyangiaceae bacterium]